MPEGLSGRPRARRDPRRTGSDRLGTGGAAVDYCPAVDPMLVITNADAGTSDQETLDRALAILREAASVEVCATSNPGELDGVLHRAGSRRIVVAGGDGSLHAVVAALH